MTDREGALAMSLDAAGMGTWVWRRAEDRVEWDARMEELFGCEPGDFGGTFDSWRDLVHPEDRERVLETFDAAMQAKSNFNVVHRVMGPAAAGRWVESWGKVFVDDDTGEVTGARGVVVDITDRRLAEERLTRVSERLALLARSGILLSSSLELDQTLKNLGRVVVPVLADGCEVVLVDGEDLRRFVIAIADDVAALREAAPIPDLPNHPIRRVLSSGQGETIRLSTAPEDFGPADLPTSARAMGVTVAFLEPIRLRGTVLGVFALSWFAEPDDLDERTDLVSDLALRAALAIDNARLFQAHRETSISLQRSLLPDDLAAPAGFEIATRYHPGRAGVEVGGDWYDVTVGHSGSLQASVGDVVGQGIAAASAMVRIRTALRTLLFDRPPARAVTDLTEHGAVVNAGFVTVLVASIGHDGRCSITCAGHLPPLVVTPDGEVRVVQVRADPALGVPTVEPYHEIEIQLAPRSRLVMFTDGLVERRRVALDEGIARLVDIVAASASADVERLADLVMEEMLDDDAHDDAALLIIQLPA